MDTPTKPQSNGHAEQATLRALPSVDRVLAHPLLRAATDVPRGVLTQAVRREVERARESLKRGDLAAISVDEIAANAASLAHLMSSPSLRPVINATGVVIHTNLGRAPLSASAVAAIARVAGYSNLEYDLEAGERGSRYSHAVQVLRQVAGCEDALVVNNNAAALVLVLATLAAGREVIVSRGQLVEIGGGFRIPDIMRQSGARLVEVGTTNRTYIADYEASITDDTAALMRVHTSNFRLTGFTTSPTIEEMARLAHSRDLLLLDDVGSGALLDTSRFGLSPEPLVQDSLRAGCDLVMFSGDKLLGGPQCGIIVGKAAVVARLRKHPLARALRVDKLTLAALEATLLHYLHGEAERQVPVWKMIAVPAEQLKQQAERWVRHLDGAGVACSVLPGESAVGGGSLPGDTLPTWLVAIDAAAAGVEAGTLAHRLRHAGTPVIARVEKGALLLDPRTVLPDQEEELLNAVEGALRASA
jgi:L-seryl-tRNA(Ser) seleniumtransferase